MPNLIIVGSGRCVWDDLEKLWPITDDVMCVNDMIIHYPGEIDHVFSCDGYMLKHWWDARRPPYRDQFKKIPQFHTVNNDQDVPKGYNLWAFAGGGTSGLAACFAGIGMGYEHIVLCGVPIDNEGHYWEAPWGKTNFQREIANSTGQIRGDGRRFWVNAKEKFNGRVKSMSGYTKKLLGAPNAGSSSELRAKKA